MLWCPHHQNSNALFGCILDVPFIVSTYNILAYSLYKVTQITLFEKRTIFTAVFIIAVLPAEQQADEKFTVLHNGAHILTRTQNNSHCVFAKYSMGGVNRSTNNSTPTIRQKIRRLLSSNENIKRMRRSVDEQPETSNIWYQNRINWAAQRATQPFFKEHFCPGRFISHFGDIPWLVRSPSGDIWNHWYTPIIHTLVLKQNIRQEIYSIMSERSLVNSNGNCHEKGTTLH